MAEASPSLQSDHVEWMTNLPASAHTKPLTQLAIPGSHDSFAFQLSKRDSVAPDVQKTRFGKMGSGLLKRPVKNVMHNWSITQTLNFTEQLHAGVRYFDLRLGSKLRDKPDKSATRSEDEHVKHFHFVHGLYGMQLQAALQEFKAFLDQHPREVVLLHFQHFYNFDAHKHKSCLNLLANVFPGKLVPACGDVRDVTLSSLWDSGHQVFAIYNHEAPDDLQPLFWSRKHVDSQWPNMTSASELVAYLERSVTREHRSPKKLFVSQAVLTPDTGLIVKNMGSTLKEKCGKKAAKPVSKWVTSKTSDNHKINICIADFVEMENFVANVIRLNLLS